MTTGCLRGVGKTRSRNTLPRHLIERDTRVVKESTGVGPVKRTFITLYEIYKRKIDFIFFLRKICFPLNLKVYIILYKFAYLLL